MSDADDVSSQATKTMAAGDCILLVGAATGLAVSVVNYFLPHNGIDHSWGALLVVVSSGIVLAAALVLTVLRPVTLYLRVALSVGVTLLGLLGTTAAAYFLESKWLLGAMALALVGWLLRVTMARTDTRRFGNTRTHGVTR